jgi:hypothetical protein
MLLQCEFAYLPLGSNGTGRREMPRLAAGQDSQERQAERREGWSMTLRVYRPWPPIHIDLRGRHPRRWRADIEAVHRLLRRAKCKN